MGKPKVKASKPKPKTAVYSISVDVGGQHYQGSGDTLLGALQAVPRPSKIMGKGTIVLTNGEKTVSKVMWPLPLKRLFYPAFAHIHVKNLQFLLK